MQSREEVKTLWDALRMLCNSREEFSKGRIHPGIFGSALDSLKSGDIFFSSLLLYSIAGGK